MTGEQGEQHAQRGLQISVGNIFGTRVRQLHPRLLHQFEDERHVGDPLLEAVRGEVVVIMRYEVAFQEADEEDEVDAVAHLRVQLRHFEVHLAQVPVSEVLWRRRKSKETADS